MEKIDVPVRLTAMFETIEAGLLADELERNRAAAKTQFKNYSMRLNGPDPATMSFDSYREREAFRRAGDFVFFEQPEKVPGWHAEPLYEYTTAWSKLREALAAGKIRPNFRKAASKARQTVADLKTQFVAKQGAKLLSAIGNRIDLNSLSGTLRRDVIITGSVSLTFSNGDSFVMDFSIITNNRTGRWNGEPTYFHQFPSRFKEVKFDNEAVDARLSETWMKRRFSKRGTHWKLS